MTTHGVSPTSSTRPEPGLVSVATPRLVPLIARSGRAAAEAANAGGRGWVRLLGNATSLLASDLVNRATTFVLYALVARYLGAHAFGQMSLALTIFYMFQIISVAGLKTLIAREVARDRAQSARYLVHAIAVVLLTSGLSIAGIAALVTALSYARDTTTVVLLLSAGLVPYALASVTEAIFIAWERMHYVVYANVPANLVKVGLALALLSAGLGLMAVVWLMLFGFFAVLVVDAWLLARHVVRPRFTLDPRFVWRLTRSTGTFLGIDGVIAVTSSLNIVLISKFAGETEVGFYSAASQVMVPVMLIYQSIVLAVFPLMCRRSKPGLAHLKTISERLIELLVSISLPAGVALAFLAEPTLRLLYGGGDIVRAAPALRIMISGLVLIALTHVLGQALIAANRERVNLGIVAVDFVVSLIAGFVLISQFGYIGAAVTALLVRLVDFVLHYLPVARQFNGIPLLAMVWRPGVATLAMSLYLLLSGGRGLLVDGLGAGLVYLSVLLLLVALTIGGPSRVRARYIDIGGEVA